MGRSARSARSPRSSPGAPARPSWPPSRAPRTSSPRAAAAPVVAPAGRAEALELVGGPAVALDAADPAAAIREHAPDGVDRIIEVGFSENVDLDARVARNTAVIAAYATRADRPGFPFWPM